MVGHEIVAYEYLEQEIDGIYQPISIHADIDDEDQTVTITDWYKLTVTKRILLSDYEAAVENGDSTTFNFAVAWENKQGFARNYVSYGSVTFSGSVNDPDKSYELEYDDNGIFTGYITMDCIIKIYPFDLVEGNNCVITETELLGTTNTGNDAWTWVDDYYPGRTFIYEWSRGQYFMYLGLDSSDPEGSIHITNSYKRYSSPTSITVKKQIKASDYDSSMGDLTVNFHLSGTSRDGDTVEQDQSVVFNSSIIAQNTDDDGLVTLTTTFSDLPAGTYTVEEDFVCNWTLAGIQEVENGTVIDGDHSQAVTFTVDGLTQGSALFVNEKASEMIDTTLYIDSPSNSSNWKEWSNEYTEALRDTVTISGLNNDANYRLTTVLMDKTTGKELGRKSTTQVSSKMNVYFYNTLNYVKSYASVLLSEPEIRDWGDIAFSDDLAGHEIVAYQYLEQEVRGEYQMVSSHADINDADQTVKFTTFKSLTVQKRILLSDYEQAVKHGDNTNFTFAVSLRMDSSVPWMIPQTLPFYGDANDTKKSFKLEYDASGNFTGYITMSYTFNHIPNLYTTSKNQPTILYQVLETGDWSKNQFDTSYFPANTDWTGGCYDSSGKLVNYTSVDLTTNRTPTVQFTNTYKNRTTSITIDKQITASEYDSSMGDLTVNFHLSGTTSSGTAIEKDQAVTFTSSYINENTDENGFVTLSATFDDLAAGTYTVEEDQMDDFYLASISNIQNGTIVSGDHGRAVTFTVTTDTDGNGYAKFINEKQNEMSTVLSLQANYTDYKNIKEAPINWFESIEDQVSISDLIDGATYRLTTVLVDKTTGTELIRKSTTNVSSDMTVKFSVSYSRSVSKNDILDAGSGEITIPDEMAGHEIVAYEYLEREIDGIYQVVSAHDDINDADQTVKISEFQIFTVNKRILLTDYEQAVENGDSTTFTFGVSCGAKTGVLTNVLTSLAFDGDPNSADKSYTFEYDDDGEFTGYIVMSYTFDKIPKMYRTKFLCEYYIYEASSSSDDLFHMPDTTQYANDAWEGGLGKGRYGEWNTYFMWLTGYSTEFTFTNKYKYSTTSITIDKQIRASSYADADGDLSFIFHLTGTSDDGEQVDRYGTVKMNAEYIKNNTKDDGTVLKSLTFDNLPAGTYTVTEIYSNGYELLDITNTENCEVELGMEGYSGVFTVTGTKQGYAVYENEKSDVTLHGKMKENKFTV
jgi:hypothetical protein